MIRIAFAVFVCICLAVGSAVAACPNDQPNNINAKARRAKTHAQPSNCVDLNAVPQISANIVGAEPAPIAKRPDYSLPTAAPYEGPTLGFKKAPTVGYHWQLQ